MEKSTTSSAAPASDLLARYYGSRPGWIDGTTQFRGMIERHLTPASHVLDIGAGSGRQSHFHYSGKVARFVGIDVSDEVLQNPYLDEAFRSDAAKMPFADNTFDIAFSDYVFEHLPDPERAVQEIFRVLKPGGRFFVRTPNKWHYVPRVARILPDETHPGLLDGLAIRNQKDVFPKHYLANTAAKIRKIFLAAGFQVSELSLIEKEPLYLVNWPPLFSLAVAYERLINSTEKFRFLRANILGTFLKPDNAGARYSS
jgi:SAM-dependent methyltransferase